MLTSRVKSGHLAPPSGMQNRFEQFSRQAQTAHFCRVMEYVLELRLLRFLRELVDDFIAAHKAEIFASDTFKVAAI